MDCDIAGLAKFGKIPQGSNHRTKGYYAGAKVERITPDPSTPGMYLALIEPGSYLDFATPVPFADKSGPLERGILNEAGHISRRSQAAVRGLSPSDFSRVVAAGPADENQLLSRTDFAVVEPVVRETRTSFIFDEARERVAVIVSRVVRDRVFRRIVLRACDERCAVTGLKLINGGGRAEAVAAHIRPVDRPPFRTSLTARPIAARTCQNFPVFFAFSQDLQSDLQFACS